MKKERILVFENKNGSTTFENAVETAQQGANDLIQIFESFQPYKKIKSLDDFEKLIIDPLAEFDEALQKNVNFQESGGKKGNPDIIARLFDIDRDSYRLIIKGEKIIEGSCKPCSKLKVKQIGKCVINYSKYKEFEKYLIWVDDRFEINENTVSEKKETFNYFIEDPKQIECYHFWHNACETLNELSKRGLLDDLYNFSKQLKGRITFSFQAGKLSVDEATLLQELQSINKN
jgi:hypothetical protein